MGFAVWTALGELSQVSAVAPLLGDVTFRRNVHSEAIADLISLMTAVETELLTAPLPLATPAAAQPEELPSKAVTTPSAARAKGWSSERAVGGIVGVAMSSKTELCIVILELLELIADAWLRYDADTPTAIGTAVSSSAEAGGSVDVQLSPVAAASFGQPGQQQVLLAHLLKLARWADAPEGVKKDGEGANQDGKGPNKDGKGLTLEATAEAALSLLLVLTGADGGGDGDEIDDNETGGGSDGEELSDGGGHGGHASACCIARKQRSAQMCRELATLALEEGGFFNELLCLPGNSPTESARRRAVQAAALVGHLCRALPRGESASAKALAAAHAEKAAAVLVDAACHTPGRGLAEHTVLTPPSSLLVITHHLLVMSTLCPIPSAQLIPNHA